MDRFDGVAIGAVVVLAIGSIMLMHGQQKEVRPDRNLQERGTAVAAAAGGELGNGVRLAKKLLEAGDLGRAEPLLQDLRKKFPYQAELAMLMGDLFMRRQEPVTAMHAYKEAIDLNPDYLDKKTPQFQGKKLKVAVGEALVEIDSRLKAAPGDEALKREKKVIYYLYRKIAGSCG